MCAHLPHDLDVVVTQIVDLKKLIDMKTVVGSDSLRMLVKSGLIVFAKRFQKQLGMMKHNCIRKVVQKVMAPVESTPGEKVQLHVRVLGNLVTVVLRPDYEP